MSEAIPILGVKGLAESLSREGVAYTHGETITTSLQTILKRLQPDGERAVMYIHGAARLLLGRDANGQVYKLYI